MHSILPSVPSHALNRGFTIIELTLVIVVIGILVGVAFDSMVGYQSSARDKERASDISLIAESLERYYRTHAVAIGATYPSSSTSPSNFATIVNNIDAVTAPSKASNSITIATSANDQSPAVNEYIYQPLNIDASLCDTAPCVRYKLFYKLEATGAVIVKNSLRQQ